MKKIYGRTAFTMIELIFVIVILGILAAVAIPKLAATRDDAQATKAAANLSIAINDIGSDYTAKGVLDITATGAPTSGDCFLIVANDDNGDGNDDSIIVTGVDGDADYCSAAINIATKNGLVKTHFFGGSRVSF